MPPKGGVPPGAGVRFVSFESATAQPVGVLNPSAKSSKSKTYEGQPAFVYLPVLDGV